MESACSILTQRKPMPSFVINHRDAINFKDNQMDCVSSVSNSIVVSNDLSKDDSSSCDDPPEGPGENGIGGENLTKKTAVTLAKSVVIKNLDLIRRNSVDMDSSDTNQKSNADENLEESISLDGLSQGFESNDPLTVEGNPIVLSESDGEADGTGDTLIPTAVQLCTDGAEAGDEVISPAAGRIQVRVPSSGDHSLSTQPALTATSLSPPDTTVLEILSEDNSSAPRKQIKLIMPASKKPIDGTVQAVKIPPDVKECLQCGKMGNCTLMLELSGATCYLCSDQCMVENRFAQKTSLQRAFSKPIDPNRPVIIRKCGQCKVAIKPSDNTLSWETMDFCNEDCLKQYQNNLGMQCSYCHQQCQEQSLGKYCVRFGFDIRQFCHSTCLEDYKKGIKVCSFCQEDIPNNQGFMAAINDRQQFKEFCSESCMTNYDKMSNNMPVQLMACKCDVCNKFKLVTIEVIKTEKCSHLCSEVCFNAFKFVNPHPMGFCDMCRKYFDTETLPENYYTFADDAAISFCSKTCMNAYVIFKRKIVQCNWCKVKKYNFDMIKKIFSNRQVMMLCSFHCFSMWKQSPKRNTCDHCKTFGNIQYHLGMSDGTLRSFCGHECLMKFQLQFKKIPVTPSSARPVDAPATLVYPVATNSKVAQVSVKSPAQKKADPQNSAVAIVGSVLPSAGGNLATICAPASRINDNSATIPVISSVTSLESCSDSSIPDVPHPVTVTTPKLLPPRKPVGVLLSKANVSSSSQVLVKQQLLLVPTAPVSMCNKSTYFNGYPTTKSKGIYCRPNAIPAFTQTDTDYDFSSFTKETSTESESDEVRPTASKSCEAISSKEVRVKEVPVIIPIPIPIYIPVPIPMYSIPTPTPVPIVVPVPICIPTPHESLEKILNDIQELCCKLPALAADNRRKRDESGLYSSVLDIDLNNQHESDAGKRKRGCNEEAVETSEAGNGEESNKRRKVDSGSKRQSGGSASSGDSSENDDGGRRAPPGGSGGGGSGGRPPSKPQQSTSLPSSPPKKYLKHVFGVNAWKKWVTAKNEEISKEGGKVFGTELLRLSSDELSTSLSLFACEFCKPSGQPYPADVIYYLVLGIQQYLYENGREDNIFTDSYYDKFTDTFDDIINKEVLLDNSEFLVPRIEEEHLWESQQLGPHSPFALLLTLVFFTTKSFFLTDVDSHMNISFTQLMKQWNRTQNSGDKPPTKYTSLRYFPPNQSKGDCSKDVSTQECKKKCELFEDFENPFRCPVSLYQYYISKCPENVRNRNDVFYLQPERSWLADSPFWYTTEPLDRTVLTKMFNRLRLVKEISLVLNSSSPSSSNK